MSDYDRIAQAISFITHQVNNQPTLNDIAAHVHLSPYHFQRLFCRWAGVTPKRFLQVLTLERAKQLLREAKPLLEIAPREERYTDHGEDSPTKLKSPDKLVQRSLMFSPGKMRCLIHKPCLS